MWLALNNFDNSFNERWEFPFHLVHLLNKDQFGIQGSYMKGYGSAELSKLGAGLVTCELYRNDPSLGTFYAVHTGVACLAIYMLGNED